MSVVSQVSGLSMVSGKIRVSWVSSVHGVSQVSGKSRVS